MYAARRRQKSVRGKFQFGKLCIGQQFQLLDNALRQLPQGGFIGHQVALHRPPHSSGADRADDFGADVSLASSASFSSVEGRWSALSSSASATLSMTAS